MRTFSAAVVVWRDRRWLALLPSLAGLLVCAAGAARAALSSAPASQPHGLALIAALGAALTGFWLFLQRIAAPHPRPGAVRIADGAVEVDGGVCRRFPLARRRQGWVVAGILGYDVSLALGDRRVLTLRADTMDEATAVLVAAGVDPSRRALQTTLTEAGPWSAALRLRRVLRPSDLLLVGAVPAGVLAMHVMPPVAACVLLAMTALCASAVVVDALARAMDRPRVTVGSEGILIQGLGYRRFIALERLRLAEARAVGVVLTLDDGTEVLLPLSVGLDVSYFNDPDAQDARLLALMEVLRDAVERFEMASASFRGSGISAVERKGRGVGDWSRAAREALGRDYRSPSWSAEALAELACAPQADREQRIGAALALAQSCDPAIRDRLRVAADSCADPELGAAIEAASARELDEPALHRLLEGRLLDGGGPSGP